MNDIIIILIVVLVLLLILSLLLFYITKRVNVLVKKIFVDRLQEFDFLLEDKEKRVNELNNEITNKEEQLKKIDLELSKEIKNENLKNNNAVVLPMFADLEDDNIISIYKRIKYNFNFDVEKVIKQLISYNKQHNCGDL